MKARQQDGAAIGLVVILGMVLAILGGALLNFSMLFGGAHEVRHSVDAGALKIGQQVFENDRYKVNSLGGDEDRFKDVADKTGSYELGNINRVWGKTLLVAINAEEMGNPAAQNNSMRLYGSARSISNRLADRLSDKARHRQTFNDIAQYNHSRMLGKQVQVIAHQSEGFETSLLDKGEATNVYFFSSQLPGQALLESLNTEKKGNRYYLKGYEQVKIGEKIFFFVPFKHGEKTHLVSASTFKDKDAIAEVKAQWGKPVPNAFSAAGETSGEGLAGQSAVAYIKTNPQKEFNLTIPHAFVRIRLERNKLDWTSNQVDEIPGLKDLVDLVDIGLLTRDGGNYSFAPEEKITFPFAPAGLGALQTVRCKVGTEYENANLYNFMFALPAKSGEPDAVLTPIVERINQIDPAFTKDKLLEMLKDKAAPTGIGPYDFLVYPDDNGKIRIDLKNQANASWFDKVVRDQGVADARNNAPDGTATIIIKEEKEVEGGSLTDDIYAEPIPVGPIPQEQADFKDWLEKTGTIEWTPGTGFNSCLGQVTIKRHTRACVNGIMVPPGGGIIEDAIDVLDKGLDIISDPIGSIGDVFGF